MILNFDLLIYDKHRVNVLLIKDAEGVYRLPPTICVETSFAHYTTAVRQMALDTLGIECQVERPLLLQFDREKAVFILTLVLKEILHTSKYEWFNLSELPAPVDEISMRALRAEMVGLTQEIPEIC